MDNILIVPKNQTLVARSTRPVCSKFIKQKRTSDVNQLLTANDPDLKINLIAV
jgi:hypothetical protein